MRFIKKPVVIEAVQVQPRMDQLSPAWWADAIERRRVLLHGMGKYGEGPVVVEVDTGAGIARALPGDWIIRGVKGELYPCRKAVFDETYEPITGALSTKPMTLEIAMLMVAYLAFTGRVGPDEQREIARDLAKMLGPFRAFPPPPQEPT